MTGMDLGMGDIDWGGWYGFDRGYRWGLGGVDGVVDMGRVGKGRYGCGEEYGIYFKMGGWLVYE